MKRATLIAIMLLLWTTSLCAGHGLMNAFNDVDALPDPGLTPAQFGYDLDRWEERARLALAGSTVARYALALEFAREKLAEIEALVIHSQGQNATDAITAYASYLDIAAQSLDAASGLEGRELGERFGHVLLEHRYLIARNYLDFPRGSRTVISAVIDAATAHYDALTPTLTQAFKASQFFKEEEVRWSWETAQQADEQGL